MSIHVFGIRHHGPGCARALKDALQHLEPDIVLVEGPPDAQNVLPLMMNEGMQPPVALLIYVPDDPRRAVYYPFTHFSPEWQALSYAFGKGIPARFMDLPQAIQFAREEKQTEPGEVPSANIDAPHKQAQLAASPAETTPSVEEAAGAVREDPLALLAEAAGYTDHELWWEQTVEQRRDSTDLFQGILEAMETLRAEKQPKDEVEAQREAHMRQCIRAAQKEGFSRIAVVCGAWHAPVLTSPGAAKSDNALLSKCRRVKVEATWIPWTNSRLSYRSGYGAGITSPGWYEHLWAAQGNISVRWLTRAAHLLRQQDLDASSASVIEAVRLGETLAALRDQPMPGLADLHEAIQTVLCHGNAVPMTLIREKLEIGDRLGTVPSETPAVPLQRDLEAQQRSLKLKPSTEIINLDLDLRKEVDHGRSVLLHRLLLLGIQWGTPQRTYGKSGTFHELWQLQWQVEFVVTLIEKNVWGNTVEAASSGYIGHVADDTHELPALSELLQKAMLAELSDALEHLLQVIQQRAAVSADVQHLMRSLPALAQVARYGNVRQTRTEHVLPIIDGLFERIVIGLPGACASLDDDAALQMVESIEQVQDSIALLDRAGQREEWQQILRRLQENETIHGLVRGRCSRLLLDQQVIGAEELARLAGLALSTVVPAEQAAAWIEGILRGSALTILHQDAVWQALDSWLSNLMPEQFEALLPVLRRAFANFQPPERRAMGEKVRGLRAAGGQQADKTLAGPGEQALDRARAAQILPVLAQWMGVTLHEH